MPAWVPGSYEILDSARHVQEFEARSARGRLPWRRVDKQTWSVSTRGGRAVEIRYRVFANTVNCTASSLDATHAHITGGTVFLYVVGGTRCPHELVLGKAPGWRIATGLQRTADPRLFRASDYDTLIDCPIEVSDFQEIAFTVAGKKHHVVLHDYGKEKKNAARFARDCKKFVQYFAGLFGGLPYRDYWFLCHFHPTIARGGGLEHRNSTHITLPQYLDSEEEKDYDRALEFASHEFFHLWNVKRLRPVGLGPFDLTKESYTTSLWLAEGITEYYGGHALRRSGVWSRERYLESLARLIDSLQDMPGERLMSVREASLTTWTNAPWHRLRAPDDVNLLNSYVSYYTKGALLGWLLDLEMRRATRGRRSLDHAIRLLWKRFGQKEVPYPEHALEEVVGEVAGESVRRWLAAELSRPKRIDFSRALRKAGIRLEFRPMTKKEEGEKDRRKIDPAFGIEAAEHGETVRVANLVPGGPAEKAGLDKGDQLLAVDGEKLTSANWRPLVREKAKARRVEVAVFRHHRLLRIPLRPRREVRRFASLALDAEAPPSASRIGRAWLGR